MGRTQSLRGEDGQNFNGVEIKNKITSINNLIVQIIEITTISCTKKLQKLRINYYYYFKRTYHFKAILFEIFN